MMETTIKSDKVSHKTESTQNILTKSGSTLALKNLRPPLYHLLGVLVRHFYFFKIFLEFLCDFHFVTGTKTA